MKISHELFWLLNAYKSYVDNILFYINCAIALCLKNVCNNLKYFIVKKCYYQLSLQQDVILLMKDFASMLVVWLDLTWLTGWDWIDGIELIWWIEFDWIDQQ